MSCRLTFEWLGDRNKSSQYELLLGLLEEDEFSTTFHRPTTEDQDLISLLDSKAKEGMDMDGFDSSMREMDLLSLREKPTRPWEEVDPTVMLKDAAGAAIYGARAANGVILVTEGTK